MPRLKSVNRLTTKLAAAKALEAEIRALQLKDRGQRKALADARFRIVGREMVVHLENTPASELAKAVLAMLAKNLTKPAERRLFPELAPIANSGKAEEPAQMNT